MPSPPSCWVGYFRQDRQQGVSNKPPECTRALGTWGWGWNVTLLEIAGKCSALPVCHKEKCWHLDASLHLIHWKLEAFPATEGRAAFLLADGPAPGVTCTLTCLSSAPLSLAHSAQANKACFSLIIWQNDFGHL